MTETRSLGPPDSGGDNNEEERTRYHLWLSTIVKNVTQFLFLRTESILPIQPINSATYQRRPTTSVAGSNVGKLPGNPPRPEPLAVPGW
jgi:hypothetical protein